MTNGISAELIVTMKRAGNALKHAGVPFALAGGFAAYARGGTSSDHDVDFILKEEDAERALQVLGEAGFRVEYPPEDWLVKVYDGELLVDLIFRPVERPVTEETLADVNIIHVEAAHLPVLSASTLMIYKLLTFGQHYCDYSKALPLARSLREQIDWERVRAETKHSPYAQACLYLLDLLDVTPPTDSGPTDRQQPVGPRPAREVPQ